MYNVMHKIIDGIYNIAKCKFKKFMVVKDTWINQ